MKSFKIFFLVLLVLGLLFSIFSCGSKEKDKALKYIKELNEYIKSTELLNLSYSLINTAIVKDANGEINFDNAKFSLEFNTALEKKKEEIAKKVGFKDFKEAESVLEKLKDEKEIKEQVDIMKNELKKLQNDFEKEGLKKVEDLKQQNIQKQEEQKFDPETGEVSDNGKPSDTKTKVKEQKEQPSEKKEVEKKEVKETKPEKKQVEKPAPKNGVEHPEDNLP